MMRTVSTDDTPALLAMTHDTGFFKPMEIDTLREVLKDYHEDGKAQGERCFVREEDGKIVGFVYYAPEPMTEGTWSLWWIVVRPGVQGKGLGAALLKFVEDDVRGHGARILFLETSGLPQYEPTRRFYLKNGYEEEARLRDYYTDGDDEVVYRKRL
jgi:ribosomal protein S18 acetylase RimI-like enzyme